MNTYIKFFLCNKINQTLDSFQISIRSHLTSNSFGFRFQKCDNFQRSTLFKLGIGVCFDYFDDFHHIRDAHKWNLVANFGQHRRAENQKCEQKVMNN